jgi:hypothetical protein
MDFKERDRVISEHRRLHEQLRQALGSYFDSINEADVLHRFSGIPEEVVDEAAEHLAVAKAELLKELKRILRAELPPDGTAPS